jgi:HK97 family phage portal protein
MTVKRFAPRDENRNAGLLSPANFQPDTGLGTVTYQQPWDRQRGIKYGHDRESMVAAVTTAIARDVADTSRFITRAELLGTGKDFSDESRYVYALNVAASQQMTASVFWQHVTLNLLYVGESYILESRDTLTPLVGGTVEIAPGAKGAVNSDGSPQLISGYIVRNDGGEVVGTYASDGSAIGRGAIPGSVLHRVHMPHPQNILRANAPLEQAGMPIDVLHYFRQATRSILLNDGMPAGVLSVEDPSVDEEGIRSLERRANSKMADPNRKGRLLVVDATTKYTQLGSSPLGADWVSMADHFRNEVLTVFRTPESILGRGAGMTFENQHVANRSYIQNVILPIRQMVLDSLNVRARRVGHVLFVDVEAIAELAADEEMTAARATMLYEKGIITLNEAREMVGLSPVDADNTLTEPVTGPEASRTAGPEGKQSLPLEARVTQPNADRYVQALEAATLAAEKSIAEYGQAYHARLYRNITGAIRRLTEEQRDTPVGPIDTNKLLDIMRRNDELLDDLLPIMEKAAAGILAVSSSQLSITDKEAAQLKWRALLMNRVSRLVEGETVGGVVKYQGWNQGIHSDLTKALSTAYQQGESIDGATARVARLLGVDPENPLSIGHRAETIARTETIGLSNELAREQMRDSGEVSQKQWYSIGDERTRESHFALNGTTIGINEQFDVNGTMADGPHDSNLPAEEVINCRCRLIPIV